MKNEFLDNFDAKILIICTMRYFLNSTTIAAEGFRKKLLENWDKLPIYIQQAIYAEIQRNYTCNDYFKVKLWKDVLEKCKQIEL